MSQYLSISRYLQESLIPDTLKEMDESEEFKITAANLKRLGQAKLTKEERLKRQRALDKLGIPSFAEFMKMKREEKNIKGTVCTTNFDQTGLKKTI